MPVKNPVFRKNTVGRKVDGVKKNLLAIFNSIWTYILAAKGPNNEFLKQYFSLKKQKLYYYQV